MRRYLKIDPRIRGALIPNGAALTEAGSEGGDDQIQLSTGHGRALE